MFNLCSVICRIYLVIWVVIIFHILCFLFIFKLLLICFIYSQFFIAIAYSVLTFAFGTVLSTIPGMPSLSLIFTCLYTTPRLSVKIFHCLSGVKGCAFSVI